MDKRSCLLIAGEKSGEEHAMGFIPELVKNNVKVWGVGGDELRKVGVSLIYHLNEFSSWGISGVINKIPFYYKALNKIEREVEERGCRTAILIDFQTFNMKLAERLSRKGVKVLYYVAPQAWAWKSYRAKKISKITNSLFTILPFEKKWFGERGVNNIISVDHPLLKKFEKIDFDKNVSSLYKNGDKVKILLLPGSRNFEVQCLLPRFIEACRILKRQYPIEIGIVPSPSVHEYLFTPYEKEIDYTFDFHKIEEAFEWASFSLAASGTVSLSCALFSIPTIVAYDGSLLNEYIFKTFVNYSGYVSLANLIFEEEVFPELLMEEATSFNISNSLLKWLDHKDEYERIKAILASTHQRLRGENINIATYMLKEIAETYES